MEYQDYEIRFSPPVEGRRVVIQHASSYDPVSGFFTPPFAT